MKKHLLGFALFNLIVGTAMIVAILTGNFPRPATRYVQEVSRTSYQMKVRQNYETRKNYETNQDLIKVTQAVLDEKTNKLNMSFSVQRETPSTQDVEVTLTFFSMTSTGDKNWNGDFRTEVVTLSPNFNIDNKAVYSMPLSYKWLNNSGEKENFYVKAEIRNGNSDDLENVARKDSFNDFTPILLMNNK